MLFLHLLLRRAAIGVPQPTAFTATPVSASRINLAWTYGAVGLQTEVWRSGVLLATVAAGVQTYEDLTTVAGVVYTYRIRHKSGVTFSAFSATLTRSSAPAAPTMLSPSVVDSNVSVNWVVSGDVTLTGFSIHRSTSPGAAFSVLGSAGGGAGSYSDAGRPNGTYYYRVKATNGYVESAESTEVSAVVLYSPPLTAPSSLVANSSYSDRASLTWTNGDASATTEIYRGTSPDPTGLLTTIAPGVAAHDDDTVLDGTTYYYRIRHNKPSTGALSPYTASTSIYVPLAALTIVSFAENTGTGEMVLTWSVANAPVVTRIDAGSYSDTLGLVTVAARTNIGSSPQTIASGYTFVAPYTPGSSFGTGTLANLRLRNGAGVLLDQVTTITDGFNADTSA